MEHFNKAALLMSASLLFLSGTAAELPKTMPLGYCNVTENPTGTLSDKTEGAWSSGAIFIPASTAATIAGCKITGMRFGVQLLLNIDEAKAWIRTSLDGDDVAGKSLGTASEPKLARGWNEVSFDEPWVVPEGCEGFYIGYSVHQKGYSYGLANSLAPCENALFVNLGGMGWEDMSDQGTLYLQATVEGDNLPGVNLGIASCGLTDPFYMNKETLAGTLRVHNLGALPASSFDVTMLADGEPLAKTSVNAVLQPGETREFAVDFKPRFTEAGTYDISLTVDNIAEGADADPADNARAHTLHVMERALERVVLVEEFSTEQCPNCPRAASLLHSIMERDSNKGRIAAVVHHAGYGSDFFTKPWDSEYTWFYNGAEYAPAFMVDRHADNDPRPIVPEGNLETALAKRLKDEPSLQLDMKAGFDVEDDTRIMVVVKGVNFSSEPVCKSPYITLWLTENDVEAYNQAGASGTFRHQHVARAVNATWGQPVEFNGDGFEYTYTFEGVDPKWKKSDLVVVGAVHDRKGSDRTALTVANACFTGYEDFSPMNGSNAVAGISDDDSSAEAVYFTLSGVRVDAVNLVPGIYVRRCGEKSEKVIVR